jgi:hypothetical protein
VHNFVDSTRGYAQIIAKLILADAQWLEKLLIQNFARMHWRDLTHDSPLMVVDDLYSVCLHLKLSIMNPGYNGEN